MSHTPALTAQEVRRLTLFKWIYSLEAQGFTKQEASRLLFFKWLHSPRTQAQRLMRGANDA